jgi:hypothetical protein
LGREIRRRAKFKGKYTFEREGSFYKDNQSLLQKATGFVYLLLLSFLLLLVSYGVVLTLSGREYGLEALFGRAIAVAGSAMDKAIEEAKAMEEAGRGGQPQPKADLTLIGWQSRFEAIFLVAMNVIALLLIFVYYFGYLSTILEMPWKSPFRAFFKALAGRVPNSVRRRDKEDAKVGWLSSSSATPPPQGADKQAEEGKPKGESVNG